MHPSPSIYRSHFAERFEAALMTLEQLTPHQASVLHQARQHDLVLLEAPAGGGKTFVAMAMILEVLLRSGGDASGGDASGGDASGGVLFACWSPPLCLFVVRWVCQRIREPVALRGALRRLFVLHDPMGEGPRAVSYDVHGRSIRTEPATGAPPIELLVVDEAHHVYSSPLLRREVERHVTAGYTRTLLLSDISQSLGRSIPFPAGVHRATLLEVVRCSKRIVAGAMAFQVIAISLDLHVVSLCACI